MRRLTVDDDTRVCLLPYKGERLISVKGWDGFVSPDGEFYKVCESGDLTPIHDIFVEIFTDMKFGYRHLEKIVNFFEEQGYKLEGKSNKDIFIDLYGFVNIQFINKIIIGKQELMMEIGIPSGRFGHKLTDKQLETIHDLAKYNGVSYKKL